MRDSNFETELQSLFAKSQILTKRWNVVQSVLKAYQRREYILMIPAAMLQIEGVLRDLLIMKNVVKRKNGKFYATDSTGAIKLDKHLKKVEIYGLGQLLQNSRLNQDTGLDQLAHYFANDLVPDRNDILHGRRINYGKAKLATQALLALWILVIEVNKLESAKLKTKSAS